VKSEIYKHNTRNVTSYHTENTPHIDYEAKSANSVIAKIKFCHVHNKNQTKHTRTLCGQTAEFMSK